MKLIYLTKGRLTIVDDGIFNAVGYLKWYCTTNGYAMRRINGKNVLLHHLVIGYPLVGKEVDHINRDPLDNRLENLRLVTHKENMNNLGVRADNKSGIRGVYWCNKKKKWRLQYQHKYGGDFKTLDEARLWLSKLPPRNLTPLKLNKIVD